ncbi:cell envelope integrity protein TolA [Photobacterium sanguinicancri]|uniref:Cell envelope integrity protein TolA n=1 Tax=Photobacterium sanguinicancri TaxID=875932 RepID=A0AAW7XYS3_9GAMM|nr:cell envelope integrity protein TolA [Photobacterium sanguinicancri]MDO6541005.1 cell envelope integrity protein TolA [Photobacterium sanguinicancri]
MRNNNYSTAVIVSLLLHALLLVALLWGTDFSMSKPKQSGNTIQAVVVDPALVNQQAQRIRQERESAKQAERDRLRRLEQQAEALEKQRQAEEKRIRELKANKLKAEKEARVAEKERKRVAAEQQKVAEEKRKADAAAKVAKAQAAKAEAERKVKQEAAKKAEQERVRKVEQQRQAEEATRKAEEARKAKVAEQKRAEAAAKKAEKARVEAERKAAEAKALQRQQEAALNDMFAGLEAETEQRGGARGQFVSDEVARYSAIFTQMIQQNLLVDQSFSGKECVIRMRLSANGLLLDATEDGGERTLCRAAKAAVVKVSQFPMPEDPEVIEKLRAIRLTVSPE